MTMTLNELKEQLAKEDEVTLLEILDIESEDLVEAFEYKIEARYETLVEDYEEDLDD